jgi:CrcB protein
VVNIAECLLIGFLAGLTEAHQLQNYTFRAFVFTSILGAFTTFLTFRYETMVLLKKDKHPQRLQNLGLQIILGLLAVWAGIQLAKLI